MKRSYGGCQRRQVDGGGESGQFPGMSARDTLIKELAGAPESVAGMLLDYLHQLTPQAAGDGAGADQQGYFGRYWSRFYGAFEGEEWLEPAELPYEKREEW